MLTASYPFTRTAALLGTRWQGQIFLDAALRSSRKILSAIVDAVLWIMHDRGLTSGLHYLDDFLLLVQHERPTASAISPRLWKCARA